MGRTDGTDILHNVTGFYVKIISICRDLSSKCQDNAHYMEHICRDIPIYGKQDLSLVNQYFGPPLSHARHASVVPSEGDAAVCAYRHLFQVTLGSPSPPPVPPPPSPPPPPPPPPLPPKYHLSCRAIKSARLAWLAPGRSRSRA